MSKGLMAKLCFVLLVGVMGPANGNAAAEAQVTMTVAVTEPHNPKKKEEKLELKSGQKKGVRKHCRLEVDATQGYFICDIPAFSMTLQENNSLLVGKKLYRIQSIKKQ